NGQFWPNELLEGGFTPRPGRTITGGSPSRLRRGRLTFPLSREVDMGGSQAVLAVTVAGAFVFGMVIVLLSCLKPQLAGRLNVSEARVTGLWASMNLLLVPMAFLGGLLADLWDVRVILLLGCVLIALALLALRWATSYRAALLAFLVTGIGG